MKNKRIILYIMLILSIGAFVFHIIKTPDMFDIGDLPTLATSGRYLRDEVVKIYAQIQLFQKLLVINIIGLTVYLFKKDNTKGDRKK